MVPTSESRIFRLSILIPVMLSFVACGKSKKGAESDQRVVGIISNRPVGAVDDLYLITLAAPPLLTVSTKGKDGWKVPPDAVKAITAEQDAIESKLKALDAKALVLFRYRMTINGLAVYTSSSVIEKLAQMPSVVLISQVRQLARPEPLAVSFSAPPAAGDVNSVSFIGASEAAKLGFTGKGMRIGVLDTGIDYTHKMLGGSGKPDDYKATDPNKASALFPNAKVVGGTDLVGSDFDANSPLPANHLPKPDVNPLDEAGHGSHVAGTIAGIGDGKQTYTGVAPDAQLYAIKVFGKGGSTTDAVVIAGFEYAADPNGDGNPDDQLDVVNLSLGGGFGQPQVLYTQAVRNLSNAGTLVVASAGNSGAVDYVVGDPGTSDDAISIAASIDGAPVNWRFPAVRFISRNNPNFIVQAVEGPISKPIADSAGIKGELVDIGYGDTDLSDAQKAMLKGKVAIIQRGKAPFLDKLKRAAGAGAIGVVVYNNDPTKPIAMGGEGHVDIPAVMVTQAAGLTLLDEMKFGPVVIEFKTDEIVESPDNIDTITDFSSKGPRSGDNLLKPEIAAPGQNITSAAMGKGTEGVKMDGTSMAAPHMTGAMALIKQAHPGLNSAELKALAMTTAKPLTSMGNDIPLTRQGAGRIQIVEALNAKVISETASLSLGRIELEDVKYETREIQLRNLSAKDITLNTEVRASPGLNIDVPPSITVPAKGRATVRVTFTIKLAKPDTFIAELDGRIFFKQGEKVLLHVPALAVRTQASLIEAAPKGDGFTFVNKSQITGLAIAFNLLGEDARKPAPEAPEKWKNGICDLQSAGYRILRTAAADGVVEKIQIAFKTFAPVTTWHMCSVSVLIDFDMDGVADQEIAGITGSPLEGVPMAQFNTATLDAAAARAIRVAYEAELAKGKTDLPNYTPAVLALAGMATFSQSTLAVIEAPMDKLKKTADGKLNIKLAAQAEGGQTVEADDYLGDGIGAWIKIPAKVEDQPFYDMSELSMVTAMGGSLTLSRGKEDGKLVIYYPLNDRTDAGKPDYQIFAK